MNPRNGSHWSRFDRATRWSFVAYTIFALVALMWFVVGLAS